MTGLFPILRREAAAIFLFATNLIEVVANKPANALTIKMSKSPTQKNLGFAEESLKFRVLLVVTVF